MPNFAHKLIEGLKERDEEFYAALTNEDDLGVVIRGHIHIEHELREFILVAAPKPKQVQFSEEDFAATVRLALVLGLNVELKSALTAVGNLRNKFSHRLRMRIEKEQAANLFAAFGPKNKQIMAKAYDNLIKRDPNAGHPKKMHDIPPKDLVTMCLVALRSALIAERLTVERKI